MMWGKWTGSLMGLHRKTGSVGRREILLSKQDVGRVYTGLALLCDTSSEQPARQHDFLDMKL
jgi:hypothetical protein